MKLLHCADLHIREKDLEEINRCLQAIVITAQHERPDLVVIAGDVFDSREVKVDSGAAIMAIGFVSALAGICPVAIVLGTPAHDGAAPRILRYVRGEYDILVADHPQQAYLEDGGLFDRPAGDREPQAVITLINEPTKQYWQSAAGVEGSDREISQAMSGVFMGFGAQAAKYKCPHIAVFHGTISGATLSNGQTMAGRSIDVSADQLNLLNADAILCGHIHFPQQFGERIFYAGSIYMNNWGEIHPHGFYLHTLEAA